MKRGDIGIGSAEADRAIGKAPRALDQPVAPFAVDAEGAARRLRRLGREQSVAIFSLFY
jgi:hypothetical protein